MKKKVQYFTKEYLKRSKEMAPEQIINFLENYRMSTSNIPEKCQLISMKIEPSLLKAFKCKAYLQGIPCQTLIKKLTGDRLHPAQEGG